MFISNRKIYQLGLDDKENLLLERWKSLDQTLNTIIFVKELKVDSQEEELLNKILGSVKLNSNQYLIIDRTVLKNICVRHFNLYHFPLVREIISFGCSATEIGLNTISSRYELLTIGNLNTVFADNLSVMLSDSRKKSMLWTVLKGMYNL